ncbi:MAG: hypothetical protein WKF35_06325 [Ferruginibacter sp.]
MKKCFISIGSLMLFFTVVMVTGISGCYYNKEELLNPGSGTCDTAAVRYSTTIVSIITTSCYPCHTGNNPAGAVRLDNYNDAKANANRMYGAASHSPGFVPMPQNAPKLSVCKIQSIKKWIDAGTPNN